MRIAAKANSFSYYDKTSAIITSNYYSQGIFMLTPGNLLLTTTIILLLVGSKKIRGLGEDLGIAIKNFRETINSHKAPDESITKTPDSDQL